MREILFRGKTNKLDWVYGDLIQLHDGRKFIVNNKFGACIDDKGNFINTEAPFVCSVFPESVYEFTGLTDKNGKKIFEGDIVKHTRTLWGRDDSDIGVILWCENTCKFYRTSKFDTMEKVEIWKDTAVDYEVIGNVTDNPEMLGGGEE